MKRFLIASLIFSPWIVALDNDDVSMPEEYTIDEGAVSEADKIKAYMILSNNTNPDALFTEHCLDPHGARNSLMSYIGKVNALPDSEKHIKELMVWAAQTALKIFKKNPEN